MRVLEMVQTFEEKNMIEALTHLETLLKRQDGSIVNCLTATSIKYSIPQVNIRRNWVLLHNMAIEEYCEDFFWNESESIEKIKETLDGVNDPEVDSYLAKRNTAIQTQRMTNDFMALINSVRASSKEEIASAPTKMTELQSIWDVPNYMKVPINPLSIQSENRSEYNAERLKLAAGWLENLLIHFDIDPEILVDRVAKAYCLLDLDDLKIEFDIRCNMSVYAYRNIAYPGSENATSSGVRVIDKGFGRTTYVYPRRGGVSGTQSTTYYRSAFQEQSEAWEKLEEMARVARDKTPIEDSDVDA
jgi:hypothetical protein